MMTIMLDYPGDPSTKILLMFGEEFQKEVRLGLPGKVTVSALGGEESSFEFNEIICDTCNAEIQNDEPLALMIEYSRVYCWDCHMKYHKTHLVRGEK